MRDPADDPETEEHGAAADAADVDESIIAEHEAMAEEEADQSEQQGVLQNVRALRVRNSIDYAQLAAGTYNPEDY